MLIKFISIINKIFIKEINPLKNYFLFFLILLSIVNRSYADNNEVLLWKTSAGSSYSTRFFEGEQINKNNIKNLTKLWTFNSGSTAKLQTVQSPPIFVGDQLLLVTLSGDLISLSPTSGKILWKKKLDAPLGKRGFTYHKSNKEELEGIYVASGKNVIHLKKNGEIKNKFLTGLSLVQPFLDEKNLYVATLREGVKAFDLKSKKKIWSTALIKNNVNARVWSGFSFDKETNSLFVVTSNPGGIIGENRSGDDFSASLISIDADSGNIKWQFKHVVNDLWDFDLISNPIIVKNLKIQNKKELVNCVIALSKTGDVIMVNIDNGLPVFDNSYVDILVQKSDMKNVYTPPTQKFYLKPEKFSKIEVDLVKDFSHLEGDNFEYIKSKLRHAKSGFYIPTSVNHDVVLYGVHGGAEWPGATIYRDNNSANLIIPSNKTPWILRLNYQEKKYLDIYNNKYLQDGINFALSARSFFRNIFKNDAKKEKVSSDVKSLTKKNFYEVTISKSIDTSFRNRTDVNDFFPASTQKKKMVADIIYKFMPGSFNNKFYSQNCSTCHGNARQGRYEFETKGDKFYPSLVGITKTKKWSMVDSYEKVSKIHKLNNIDLKINMDEYNEMMNYFDKFDEKLFKDDLVVKDGFWQILLDKKGLPATRPPWGKITNINLSTGEKVWEIPFGQRKINNKKYVNGDQNFGGVISTKSKIIFASGNPDPMAYAYNLDDGKKIWESELPYSGSAPPIAFSYKGCEVVVFTATGGRYVGYRKNGDSTVAYKLNNCEFK
ncbi:PQQ-binding-like beta-propeller repeat protein [Candidatus Pelagibacter sp.]|nr:PQQ-binding-like beta-propeller repeat protein [Candidatus Pelagibacter sp.]